MFIDSCDQPSQDKLMHGIFESIFEVLRFWGFNWHRHGPVQSLVQMGDYMCCPFPADLAASESDPWTPCFFNSWVMPSMMPMSRVFGSGFFCSEFNHGWRLQGFRKCLEAKSGFFLDINLQKWFDQISILPAKKLECMSIRSLIQIPLWSTFVWQVCYLYFLDYAQTSMVKLWMDIFLESLGVQKFGLWLGNAGWCKKIFTSRLISTPLRH